MHAARTYAYCNSHRHGDTGPYSNCHACTGPYSYAGIQSNSYTSFLCYSYGYAYDSRSNVVTCEYPD